MLSSIFYYSEVTPDAVLDLRTLLAVSHRNNDRDGITGFLFCAGHYFLQIIEGDRQHVSALYTRIVRDPRHHRIILLRTMDTAERAFPGWLMGLREGNDASVRAIFKRVLGSETIDPTHMDADALHLATHHLAIDVLSEMSR